MLKKTLVAKFDNMEYSSSQRQQITPHTIKVQSKNTKFHYAITSANIQDDLSTCIRISS